MSKHDFSVLWEKYPEIIADMPVVFDSHRFILRLAQKSQDLYVEALYSHRDSRWRETPAPFMFVHQALSDGLNKYPELVTPIGEVTSPDI